MRRNNSAFTLIEVLASAGLAVVGVVGCMVALGSMTHAEALGREREAIANLALEKYGEVVATTDLSQTNQLNGDFTDRNDNDHTWTGVVTAVNTTSTASVVNTADAASTATVDSLSVTVVSSSNPDLKYTVTGLVEVPPTTTTTTGGGAAGGTGAAPAGGAAAGRTG